MDQISFAMLFAEVIGQISTVVISNEVRFLEITRNVIMQFDAVEAEFRNAQKDLAPEIIKLGDVAGYKASRMYEAVKAKEALRNNAEISLDFVRVMCDVAGANGIESEGYQQYNRLYNQLANFLQHPLRGYEDEDFPSMSLDELEYVDAQIKVRERSEFMSPFTITYLEMVRKRITEQIAFRKSLFPDDDLPND